MLLVIEIGTNSTKSVVVIKSENGIIFSEEKVMMGRLGEGLVESGYLSDNAIRRNLDILSNIINTRNKTNIDEIIILATQVLRTARNYADFKDKVKDIFDIDIIVLSPTEEAICAFYSQNPFHKSKCDLVLDIGGGSTELIRKDRNNSIISKSYPIGVVYMKEIYEKNMYKFDSSDGLISFSFDLLKNFIDNKELNRIFCINERSLIGTGGTFTTLASIKYGLEKFDISLIEGAEMSIEEIKNILNVLLCKENVKGLPLNRADIMPYGVAILLYIMEVLNIEKIKVTCKGVRHGYVNRMLDKAYD